MADAKQDKIPNTTENWENRKLGADEAFAEAVSPEEEAAIKAALQDELNQQD